MALRKLKIKNFRNVGVQEEQELLLNTSFEKGQMGNLVVLVGPNNCGKSNCLDALVAFGKKNGVTSKDIPDFDNENPSPEVCLMVADGDVSLGMRKTLSKQKVETEEFFFNDKKASAEESRTPSAEAVSFALAIVSFNVNNGQVGNIDQQFQQRVIDIARTQKINGDGKLLSHVHAVNSNIWGRSYLRNQLGLQLDEKTVSGYLFEFAGPSCTSKIVDWEAKKEFKICPNITKFADIVTTNKQLTTSPEELSNSPFFKVLLSAIDFPVEALVNCYKKAREQNMNGLLKKTCKEINTKLESVTQQFNKMFFLKEKKYRFEITLETTSIYLSVFMDEIPLHLDKQSSGFRWFFNFYFSVIAQTNLQRGDIVVMDEPATNLHMQGIQELRSFIKDYAKKTELTFVISTHLPFFVDVNYLEEVRIVNRVGDGAIIDNKFHAIGEQETDALKPIKDALTVGRYVLYDQGNTNTIFVEGITDYCYLTAFKLLNKVENLVFLPIQGVKKTGIVDTLTKAEKYPKILVDGDAAGVAFKERNKGRKNVEIITLSEIDPKWETIEDLFSTEDKQKTKAFNDCVAFKNSLTSTRVSKETKDNFKKLLENLAV